MNKIIRWILVLPVTTIIGGLLNFIIVESLSLFGEHFIKLIYFPLQYFLIPFVIGVTTLLFGSYIIPSRNKKSIKKLLIVLIIFNVVSVWLLAPNTELTKDFTPTNLQILDCIFATIGGIVGYILVRSQIKRDEEIELNGK